MIVVVALIVDWEGLPGCCDVYWFFHGWRRLRKGCISLYVEYDLLHTGVHLLWLWEFWIGTSAWWLCWTCWRNTTVLFRSSTSVWLPLCRCVIYFLQIDGITFLSARWSLLFLVDFFCFWRRVLSNLTSNRSVVLEVQFYIWTSYFIQRGTDCTLSMEWGTNENCN